MYGIIVGCGRVGSQLARLLAEEGHDVVIIDKRQSAFRRLGDSFNGLTLCGNGINVGFLKTAGIEKADFFCALTERDNTNLMISQISRKMFNVRNVFARVYDAQQAEIFASMGIEIISGTMLIAAMVKDKITQAQFSSYFLELADLGILRVRADKELTGQLVRQINIDGEFLVAGIVREGQTIIPGPDTLVEMNDLVIAVVKKTGLDKIKKKFGISGKE